MKDREGRYRSGRSFSRMNVEALAALLVPEAPEALETIRKRKLRPHTRLLFIGHFKSL